MRRILLPSAALIIGAGSFALACDPTWLVNVSGQPIRLMLAGCSLRRPMVVHKVGDDLVSTVLDTKGFVDFPDASSVQIEAEDGLPNGQIQAGFQLLDSKGNDLLDGGRVYYTQAPNRDGQAWSTLVYMKRSENTEVVAQWFEATRNVINIMPKDSTPIVRGER